MHCVMAQNERERLIDKCKICPSKRKESTDEENKYMAKYLALSSFRSSWKTKRIEEEEEELAHRYSLDIHQENETWKKSIPLKIEFEFKQQAGRREEGEIGLEKHAMSVRGRRCKQPLQRAKMKEKKKREKICFFRWKKNQSDEISPIFNVNVCRSYK